MSKSTCGSGKVLWIRGAFASAVSLVLVSSLTPVMAQADPAAEAGQSEAAMAAEVVRTIGETREFWTAAAVPSEVQSRLEAGLREGALPESMKAGSIPVDAVETSQDGNRVNTTTFADGSVTRTLVQEKSGTFDASALGISNGESGLLKNYKGAIEKCKVYSGAGFARREGCAVSGSNGGGVRLGFVADYTLVQGKYNDSISARHSAYQQCNGAVCDEPRWNQWIKEESASRSALVSMTARWELGGVSSGTAELKLVAGNNAVSATLSS